MDITWPRDVKSASAPTMCANLASTFALEKVALEITVQLIRIALVVD